MLVKPRFNHDLQMGLILGVISGGKANVELETGIYEIGHFSLNYQIGNIDDEYYDFGELDAGGVCDEIDQVKEKYSKWINDPVLKFCISFTKIVKADEPHSGGWRWHKWGDYIGVKDPQHEYIAHEGPEIEHVYVYQIYKLKN